MLAKAAERDLQLRWLTEDIQTGKCRKALTKYTKIFEELMLVRGVIVRGEQLIIPEELQQDVIQLAHEGHTLGYEKTLGLLRESCWFPGMGDKVKTFVEECRPCQIANPQTEQEPLKPTLLPEGHGKLYTQTSKGQ